MKLVKGGSLNKNIFIMKKTFRLNSEIVRDRLTDAVNALEDPPQQLRNSPRF